MSEDKVAIQEQMDSRLRSLTQQQAFPQATATKSGSGISYGLISLILVALLAFAIGQFSQNAMPELVEKVTAQFNELKAKYLTK